MMNRNKICPECETEYMPEIGVCADCGAFLVSHEEYKRVQEEKRRQATKDVEDAAVVREGDLKWLEELREALTEAGIPSTITSDPRAHKGCCAHLCLLVVSKDDLERAQARIEEYFREVHPELQASHELASQGRCPACGSPVKESDTECADCGLTLMIIEEEE